jgi:hypothetical protein
MSNEIGSRVRYGEAFWRAHHEAWQQSALNQREYCETQGIPLKAFGNWRARCKAEPQPLVRKLLYRRRGLSRTLSHSVSHSVSHMTYGCAEPIVPQAREGHRRKFSEADKSPTHLPREDMRFDLEHQGCPCCGGDLHVIGETVSEMRLHSRRAMCPGRSLGKR